MNLDDSLKHFWDTTVLPGLKQIIGADYQTKLNGVFGSSTGASADKPDARPPFAKTAAKAPAKTAAKAPAKSAAKAKKPGEKRTPAELNRVVENLHDYIVKHPGARMEVIAKGMGKTTSELNLPMKKLLAAKRIKTVGEKRATEYTAA